MLRAAAVAESAGVPSTSVVCEGFVGQAGTTSVGLGYPNLAVSMVPGHVDTQSVEELKRNVLEVTLQSVIDNLTIDPDAAAAIKEPEPLDIVFEGTFEEVNRLYYENSWSDGLPIIPPTEAKIQNFLEFTERNPHEVLGTILPDNRSATPWNVAVNGVMAGCRPEYMPVLMALAEAMAHDGAGPPGGGFHTKRSSATALSPACSHSSATSPPAPRMRALVARWWCCPGAAPSKPRRKPLRSTSFPAGG